MHALKGYIGIGLLIAIIIGAAFTVRAKAHDFYDPDCCSGQDCAPALKIEEVELASTGKVLLMVTTIHGTKPITAQTKIRASKDSQSHGCIWRGELICFYAAPGN